MSDGFGMWQRYCFLAVLFVVFPFSLLAQHVSLTGKVLDEKSGKPVEYASVLLQAQDLWAVTNEEGRFTIKQVPQGDYVLVVQCMGYARRILNIHLTPTTPALQIRLQQESLQLEEVEVVAQRREDAATTTYTIDRTTLDNQQLINLEEISTLLPGGKTENSTLVSDNRLMLRSESQEKGNASFGTAVEVDGARIDNNAAMDESLAASTRNMSSSNIESVEIVTGIPSVEYGDLSNGVVKVRTRKGKSPFIVEGKINQHTYLLALNKGLELGRNGGLLNVSFERARSFSDIASPYTAYTRNVLSLNYMKVFSEQTTPLTLNIGVTGNVGGYHSKNDPDELFDSYSKARDNEIRGNVSIDWLLNKSWITNLSLKGSISFQDKKSEDYTKTGSASSQPYIHTQEEGYFVATDYDVNPQANIILGPTGYWYLKSFNDQKPVNASLKLNGNWTRRFGRVLSKLLVGAEYKGSGNEGRGTYYDDMRYAPTWRPYRYDELPWMHNLALFGEEKLTITTSTKGAYLQLVAGLRDDLTMINGSDYGRVSSLAPRFQAKYLFWEKRAGWVSDLSIHAGWGKSVKLPSFQILYPSPSYSDILSFTPGSTADNKAYYAYYTFPSQAIYNNDLKWQYTNQTDLGIDAKIAGTKISLSAFYHQTFHPYMSVYEYTPFIYKKTGQQAIETSGVAAADRAYSIDPQTGVVTLIDRSGNHQPQQLAYSEYRTYNATRKYVNGSPVKRYGIEWMVDFAPIKALKTSIRIDGNYYAYKGIDETLFAGGMTGTGSATSTSYPLVAYYRGSSSTSTGTVSSGSVANGSESRQVNLNAVITTHIPKVRLIVSLRLETSLYNYKRSLSKLSNGTRGIVIDRPADYFGTPYDGSSTNNYVAVYPEYYSTWDQPNQLIPFAEKFEWARDNDRTLYNELAKLVVKSNYAYTLNPDYLSKYFSANITVTKEIGDHLSVSFYANNFFNNMSKVKSSQTGQETSLFASRYIPKFYYGLSVRVKI